MTTFSRETELSFHRRAAEQEARLVADLEHILSMLVTNDQKIEIELPPEPEAD